EWRGQRLRRLQHDRDGFFVIGRDLVDERARERDARWDREPGARRRAEPRRLVAEARVVVGVDECDDLVHPRTVTSPGSPSTRPRTPPGITSAASRVPPTPGMPYPRDTIAACESRPPASVTIPPSNGSRMLNASLVDSVTSTSPCTMRSNSVGPAT